MSKSGTVTIPLNEYEKLISAKEEADAKMSEAEEIAKKNEILVLFRSKSGFFSFGGVREEIKKEELIDVLGDDEKICGKLRNIIDAATKEIEDEYKSEIEKLKDSIKSHDELKHLVDEYNSHGPLYRALFTINLSPFGLY